MNTILVVEDESIIARDICRELEKIPMTTILVSDTYKDAINKIDEIIPDLILLDIKLFEDEDAGFRIAKYLNDKYRIPFIFLSGYATENFLAKAKKEFPITFLTKPIDNKQLHVAVTMAINEDDTYKHKYMLIKGRYIESISESSITIKAIRQSNILTENLELDKIKMFKAFNHIKRNSVLAVFESGSFFLINCTINNIMKLLPKNFIKVHSSFIVNKRFITGFIGKNSIRIGNETISFGTKYKREKMLNPLNFFRSKSLFF